MTIQGGGQVVSLSECGGRVTTWSVGGEDIFYPQQERIIDGKKKIRGGMFPCFPNFGKVDPRFGLPQHGPLRDTVGNAVVVDGVKSVWFEGDKLLGGSARACKVSIEVEALPYKVKGFAYWLRAAVSPGCPVPVNAGLHPYFRTPAETATVYLGTKGKVEVDGLITESRKLPFRNGVTIAIPNVGVVEMCPLGDFGRSADAYLNLWRDSTDYFCLEPVLAPPALYGTDSPYIHHSEAGFTFRIGCSFRLLG